MCVPEKRTETRTVIFTAPWTSCCLPKPHHPGLVRQGTSLAAGFLHAHFPEPQDHLFGAATTPPRPHHCQHCHSPWDTCSSPWEQTKGRARRSTPGPQPQPWPPQVLPLAPQHCAPGVAVAVARPAISGTDRGLTGHAWRHRARRYHGKWFIDVYREWIDQRQPDDRRSISYQIKDGNRPRKPFPDRVSPSKDYCKNLRGLALDFFAVFFLIRLFQKMLPKFNWSWRFWHEENKTNKHKNSSGQSHEKYFWKKNGGNCKGSIRNIRQSFDNTQTPPSFFSSFWFPLQLLIWAHK